MKGIILAGGLGTRLRPMTLTTNKHLLRVHDRPMIHFPIACLVNAGIRESLIVTSPKHIPDFRRALGDGRDLGLSTLDFASQEGEHGVAHALLQAESYAAAQRVCVILGDNIIEKNIRDPAQRFNAQKSGARILLKETDEPERFGVARIEGGRVVEVVEKPPRPSSRLAVTGIYFYDESVFEICRKLTPGIRGELEISDVNNAYARRGDLEWEMLEGWWADVGTPESLERAARLVASSGANHP
ncbi:MAG: NTP transferase domain-containing protein [Phycisphaerae bacterium]|nr:NTP transferase domain-containing protein [Phycisphaerae bacterium]